MHALRARCSSVPARNRPTRALTPLRDAATLGSVRRAAAITALVLVTVPSAGCSLRGLDRLGFTRCMEERDCDGLDREDGVGLDDCEGWECHQGWCRWRGRDADGDHAYRAVDGSGVACPGGTDCDETSSERFEGNAERCDGVDQDCDLAIDEGRDLSGARGSPVVVLTVPIDVYELAGAEDGTAAVAYRLEPDVGFERVASITPVVAGTDLALSVDRGTVTPGCWREDDEPIAPDASCTTAVDCTVGLVCVPRSADGLRVCGSGGATCATDGECGDGRSCNGRERCAPGAAGADARGCVAASPPLACGSDPCDEAGGACVRPTEIGCGAIDRFASAPAGGGAWLAAVVAGTCRSGSLRIAHFLPDEPVRALDQAGGAERSTSWAGVDVDALDCTGASRSSGALGARDPAVAVLPADGSRTPRGLVAYVAGSVEESAPAPVELLGVWLEHDPTGRGWTHATGDGRPSVLTSPIASGAAPRVLALDHPTDAAFVVAYPVESGGAAVVLVPDLGEPAPSCSGFPGVAPCVRAGAEGPVTDIRDTHSTRSSAPVPDATSVALTGGPWVDVALAAAPIDPSGTSAEVVLALADAVAGEIVLVVANVGLDTGALVPSPAPIARLPAPGVARVSIVHVEAGLAATSSLETSGGFVVAWDGADGGFVARVRDLDRVVDEPAALPAGVREVRGATIDGALGLVGLRATGALGEEVVVLDRTALCAGVAVPDPSP